MVLRGRTATVLLIIFTLVVTALGAPLHAKAATAKVAALSLNPALGKPHRVTPKLLRPVHRAASYSQSIASGGAIMPGYDAYDFPGNDDDSTFSSLPFPIDYFGSTYTSVYINNNGNLTFGSPLGEYTPDPLNESGLPIIAPFWADVDTRIGNTVTYGAGLVNGHPAFGVNWLGVGCYSEIDSVTDTFQVLLIDRSDIGFGDFDVEFNYGPVDWDSGQASGGNSQCLGGTAARAGYGNGTGIEYELPGSGVNGALLSSNPVTGLPNSSLGSAQAGRYIFPIRAGGVPEGQNYAALGDSYSSGEGTDYFPWSADAGDNCDEGPEAWPVQMTEFATNGLELNLAIPEQGLIACQGEQSTQLNSDRNGEPSSEISQLQSYANSSGDPNLITVTLGGNDVGFSNVLRSCYFDQWVNFQPDQVDICDGAVTHAINSKLLYPNNVTLIYDLVTAYDEIQAASLGSDIVAVGYPELVPEPSEFPTKTVTSSCGWLHSDLFDSKSTNYVLSDFKTAQTLLDDDIATAATLAGVGYADTTSSTYGHQLCTPDPWINTLSAFDSGSILDRSQRNSGHPNVAGQQAIAQAVAGDLQYGTGTGVYAGKMAWPGRPRDGRPIPVWSRSALGARLRHGARNTALSLPGGALTEGLVNGAYVDYAVASGGTSPYSYAVTGGALPPGLSMSADGTITGGPTSTGTFNFTVTATDSSTPTPQTASAGYSITVASPTPLSIEQSSLPAGTVGQIYQTDLSTAGGLQAPTWAVVSGSLPAGLTLNSTTGAISGTPTHAGTSSFTLQASQTEPTAQTAQAALSLTVDPASAALTISAASAPAGTEGADYYLQLNSTGGSTPTTWSLASGALPTGLSLDPVTGLISGTLTSAGSFSFTAQVTDNSNPAHTATQAFSVSVAASAALITTANASGSASEGTPYAGILTAAGGVAPYTWQISGGALPPGLTLDPATGNISGTPTSTGTFAYTATATDSSSAPQTSNVSSSITVTEVPLSVGQTLPQATVNTFYDGSPTVSGGTGPYTWALTSGTPPPGTSFDPASGAVEGVPTATGTYPITVEVTDSSTPAQQTSVNLVINVQAAPALTLSSSTLTNGTVGAAYAAGLSFSGGTGPYTWSMTSGALPAGLSLDPTSGLISGIPSAAGTSDFTLQVADSSSPAQTASAPVSIDVEPPSALAIGTGSVPEATTGSPYQATLTATGGIGPYTWEVSGGQLPAGLSLDADTGDISGTPTGGTSTFTAQATDSSSPAAQTATKSLTLTVGSGTPLSIVTTDLATATQQASYSATLNSDGGDNPVTWSLALGTLPAGLTLDPNAGVISGTPSGYGFYNFTVQATDSSTPTAQTATQPLSLEVEPQPSAQDNVTITNPGNQSDAAGENVSLQMQGSSSDGYPLTWSATGLPPGLSIDPDTGLISGSASTAGAYNVTVEASDQTGASDSASFTWAIQASAPAVTSVSPSAGPRAGGTKVTITGTNFTGASAVDFSTVPATSFTVNSATSITATSPAGGGTVNITVVTPGGTSPKVAADKFTYLYAPAVTKVSPTSGPRTGGTKVTITGTDFTDVSGVDFSTVPAASVTVNSATSITATSSAGGGTVNITVVTPGGTSPKVAADKFTYLYAPAVTKVSPASGPKAGGTKVTITGTGFTKVSAVDFSTVHATSFTVNSATSITATSPAGGGTVNITVVTPGGTSPKVAADKFTYLYAPAVTKVSPTSGPRTGGTKVTITGTGFTKVSAVDFSTVHATRFTVNSATSITATSPAGGGTVNITVVTPGGTSPKVTADKFTYTAAVDTNRDPLATRQALARMIWSRSRFSLDR